jgi:hypothetical protein
MQKSSRSPDEIAFTSRLPDLLANASDFELLQALRDAVASDQYWYMDTTGPLPLDNTWRVYSIRAGLNKEFGLGIKGYDQLLAKLSAIPEQPIIISCVATKGWEFILFCDNDLKQLFGLLAVPRPLPDRGINHLRDS